jgi:ATP-dependent RNA helicase DeaD
MNFNEIALKDPVIRAIEDLGFETPTPIQEKVIPLLLASKQNLIGLAQTGTGKTAAFGLPLLHHVRPDSPHVQALILSPTRELGMQIAKDLDAYGKYLKGIKTIAVYGGANIVTQIKELKNKPTIVVGTPGRTLDLIRRKALNISEIEYLVLDEADEMLNMGFKEDLNAILAETRQSKQTLLFSATMPAEIRKIADKYMNQPVEIRVGNKNVTTEDVSHEYYVMHAKNRYEALKRVVDIHPKIYGIVFCRTRKETKEVSDKLMQDGYNADALHGDLSQAQRDHVMNRFRQKHLQILVATDVAARGLDVDDLTHVINYNLPDEMEAYVHRSGRTGRAGKKGRSVSFIHTRELHKIKTLEKITGQRFDYKKIPGGNEICSKQLFNLIDKVEQVEINTEQIEKFLPEIYKKLSWMSHEELIQRFVSVEFNRFLEYYKNTGDINAGVKPGDKERGKNGRDDGTVYSRFFISLGSRDGMNPNKLMGLINEACNRRDMRIGKIDLMKNFSFFEVEQSFENVVLKAFKQTRYDGNPVTVELSKSDSKGGKTPQKKRSPKRKPGKRPRI